MYSFCLFPKTYSTIFQVNSNEAAGKFAQRFRNFPILMWGLDNILSQSNIMLCFFTRVRVNAIFYEFIIKPKYSLSWHGKNIDFDG